MPSDRPTILVVDDDAIVLTQTGDMLRRAGFDVLSTTSAHGALALCREHPEPIHLALLEVVMPVMTGPDLRECLRVDYPGIRVLYMSGYDYEEMGRRGIWAIPADFLQKPFTSAKLVGKLNAALWKSGLASA